MIRPRNEKMSALNHATLCAMTMGVARLSHDLERSGSMVALGLVYRLVAPIGTYAAKGSVGPPSSAPVPVVGSVSVVCTPADAPYLSSVLLTATSSSAPGGRRQRPSRRRCPGAAPCGTRP